RRHTRFSRDWSSDVCSSDLRPRRRTRPRRPTKPYSPGPLVRWRQQAHSSPRLVLQGEGCSLSKNVRVLQQLFSPSVLHVLDLMRSEERRVGKECRSGGAEEE